MVVRRKTSALEIVKNYVKTKGTVRTVANVLGISKTTVHTRLTEFIQMHHSNEQESKLAIEAEGIIKKNKQERHLRGGAATKKRFSTMKEKQTSKCK